MPQGTGAGQRPDADEVLKRVTEELGDRISDAKLNFGQVDCQCRPEDLPEVVKALRDSSGLLFNFFTFLSGVDRTQFGGPDAKDKHGGLEVLVHLYSIEQRAHVNIHAPVDTESPSCPTITGVFLGALWHERETHEMFGINFEGHPRLVGLYLPEDFVGHPLLRSFRLPTRLVKEWPGAKDPEEAAAGGR